MNYDDLLKSMDHATYRSLRRAVELGKWPDGRELTVAQRETCLEAVIRFENLHGVDERDRVGYIHKDRQTACESSADGHDHHHDDDPHDHHHDHDEPEAIRWVADKDPT